MFQSLINPLSILLTLTTSLGVLVHDTHIDRAASTALTLPISFTTFASAEAVKLGDAHTHTERFSVTNALERLRSGQPRIQARDDKDHEYLSGKKFATGGTDSQYHWPSV
jgi:hypothetical protein